MVRVVGVVIFRLVAAITRVRRIVVIAVMAGRTIIGNRRMSAKQLIIIIVDREGRRVPIRVGRVAHITVRRYAQSDVVRVRRAVEIRCMAARTSVRCGRIIAADMTGRTIVRYRNMRPRERIER